MRIVSSSLALLVAWPLLGSVACKDKGDDSGDGTIGTVDSSDADGDGVSVSEGDCDDADSSAYPGAEEICDGVDNDCDGAIDEGVTNTYYQDSDLDGYGNPDKPEAHCDQPDGFADNDQDCDDFNAEINPGADEICDELDNDCDTEVDEDAVDADTWYLDGDGDLYGRDDKSVTSCDQPDGYVDVDGDCDDADPAYNPGATEDDCTDPNDYNCDGSVGYADEDGDGYPACEDCDDSDGAINPGAREICDDIDNDCDTLVDDADDSLDPSTGATWYADSDTDSFGDADVSVFACDAPPGYVADNTDCDDDATAVNPLATEICDGLDNDCDTLVDDADDSLDPSTATTWYADSDEDSFGDPAVSERTCLPSDGYVVNADDCDDSSSAVNPLATEVCDGIDNDCDTLIDDLDDSVSDMSTWYADGDEDSFGDAADSTEACDQPDGYVANAEDCDDEQSAINPLATEICDGLDNDCDTLIDDADDSVSDMSTWYGDGDEDGFGDSTDSAEACDPPDGYVANAEDCDDEQSAINPLATEICDGLDNDCDTLIDDDDDSVVGTSTWYGDADGDDFGDDGDVVEACDPGDGYASVGGDCDDDDAAQYPDALEYCNGEDDDCDTEIDEDAEDGEDLADDFDGDGYGDPGSTTWQCVGVDNEYDCNDADGTEPKVASTTGSSSGDGSIDSPYDLIQDAIDNALECVLVESGTYYEAIDFAGHDISVMGMGTDETVIDASGTGSPAVTFASAESTAATLTRLTVTGGDGFHEETSRDEACTSVTTCTYVYSVYSGGGIYINGANPTIDDVVVVDNHLPEASTVVSGLTTTYTSSYGGGVAVIDGAPVFTGSAILENFADQGGGFYVDETSDLTLSQSWLVDNEAVDGAGIEIDLGTASITNVVSMWNVASADAGGLLVTNGDATLTNTTWAGEDGSSSIYSANLGGLTMLNSIVYDGSGYGVLVDGTAAFAGTYNDVYGNASGEYSGVTDPTGSDGNRSVDPLLAAWSDDGDYTNDDPSLGAASPAVDAGDPDAAYNDADGSRNDMGAFGGPNSNWAD